MKNPSLIKNWQAWTVFVVDIVSIMIAWLLVGLIDESVSVAQHAYLDVVLLIFLFAVVFKLHRTYAVLWKSLSQADLKSIIQSVLIGSVVFFFLLFLINRLDGVPRHNLIFFPLMALLLMLASRYCYRLNRSYRIRRSALVKDAKNLVVIGAGAGGDTFIREYYKLPQYDRIVAILDDDPKLHGKIVHNIKIVGDTSLLDHPNFLKTYHIDQLVIAIPSINSAKLTDIVTKAKKQSIDTKILPSLLDLTSGVKITEIRDVAIEDLLGRESISVDIERLNHAYNGKTIMVTGGGGSIGSELCRQLLKTSQPEKLIILDHSEFNLYEIGKELEYHYADKIELVIGSVSDLELVEKCFRQYSIDIVFHAAAYKHVPMLEHQVSQAIKNNIIGTKNVVDCARKHHIEKFILVSTDKAVNPTNVMGATKRITELYTQQKLEANTAFITTRFGNVLGSAGSVIPLFKKQIANNQPITVTHKDIERYFMTIPEASQLVILAGALGKGYETYVLDMGKPVRITDLAENLIRLSGKVPYADIDIQFTGLRPGEKMYEELFYSKEALEKTPYEKLMQGKSEHLDPDVLAHDLDQLLNATNQREVLFELIKKYADQS